MMRPPDAGSDPVAPLLWISSNPAHIVECGSVVCDQPRAPSDCGAANRSRAAARGGGDRQHLGGGAVGRIFLPAHRSERPLQHAANAYRIRAEMKIHRALVQRALGLRRAIALAQIIEPGRAMVALGP